MMIKLLLVTLLCGVAYAGYASSHGHGWGWSGGDIGGGGGNSNGHHGWGGWNRPGWASVKLWQNDKSYHYGLKEHGKDYEKYVNVGAETHHSHGGHGWH